MEAHSWGLSGEKTGTNTGALDTPASEVRLWERPTSFPEAGHRLGICLPEESRVVVLPPRVSSSGHLIIPSIGPRAPSVRTGLGSGPGQLRVPLSFDVGPDERLYVLDAGNAHIQVFDFEGNYLTQWGHRGSEKGAVDFGTGRVPKDFAGSIAVDEEGFIYVADVGNKRIQKFAP